MLYRSNSFEGSLRNYNSPKGPVVQNKHHRENCHHNCSKMYDKHERIIHYAKVRQQEMMRSRERARQATRSRSRKKLRSKVIIEQSRCGDLRMLNKTIKQQDCMGNAASREFLSSVSNKEMTNQPNTHMVEEKP
jgi:hypothetical protein